MASTPSEKAARIAEPIKPGLTAGGKFDTTGDHTADDEHFNKEKNETSDDDTTIHSAQHGVAEVEATTKVWGKAGLIAAYAIIWFIYFITSTQEVVIRVMTPFVTSSFQLHSLTAATGIMSNIIGGLAKLPLAKLLDTWGRPQGLALCLFLWVVGFIMMAACNNVETYAAAQVFSSVGSQGVSYCLTVFVADTSSLKNRSLMLAFATSPYIVTTWIGGPFSDAVLNGPGWRWGFGIWAIVTPDVVLPLVGLFLWNHRKAKRMGVGKARSGKLTVAAVRKYSIETDLVGIIILAAGMALFLLPFSLYSYQAKGWQSPMIICMIIFGGLLIIGFIMYEKFIAPVKFIPVGLLADRTVLFGGLMFFFMFFASAPWNSYFSSMLMVVWDQPIDKTTYILNIYRVGSCAMSLVIGYLIRVTNRFKWVALYYGFPLQMLGLGLMIYLRQPTSSIGLIIMTQIFVAFAGGPLVIAGEMAMMAPSDHQHIAVIIAVLDLFCSVGYSIGATVSAAIWTGTFKPALIKYLPADAPIDTIYGSITEQMNYPVGSPIRQGISLAYAESQRYMLITSVCMLAGALLCVVPWRNIKLSTIKQVRGNVV